jgi:hypothetical protein
LESELSGDFRSVIRSLANASRPIDSQVDLAAAKKDAQELYDVSYFFKSLVLFEI